MWPYAERLSRAIAAAVCVFLSGCAAQMVTGACSKPAHFMEAGANIVMAPSAGEVGENTMQRMIQIGGMIQAATVAANGDAAGVKVVRLVPERADDPSCRPEAIRYMWSGCSTKTVLIRREPVTVIWPFAQDAGDDETYVRFAISNWIIRGSFDLNLNFDTPYAKGYRLESTVPVEDVAFLPRRISKVMLDALGDAMGCDLYSEPSLDAPRSRLANCESAFEGQILGHRKVGNRVWLKVKLRGADGWMPAPQGEQIASVFPEFGLLKVAVAYQHFMQRFHVEILADRDFKVLSRAHREFREEAATDETQAAHGVADVMLGAAQLLQGAREGDSHLYDEGAKHFGTAAQRMTDQSEAVNLHLMAELLRCCLAKRGKVYANDINVVMKQYEGSDIEPHAIRMWAFLKRDPASSSMLRNFVTLLHMLRDVGHKSFGDESVDAMLERLAPVIAARANAQAHRDLTCEERERRVMAQSK